MSFSRSQFNYLRVPSRSVGVALVLVLLAHAAAAFAAAPIASTRANPKSLDAGTGFNSGAINIFAGNGTAGGSYADGVAPTSVSIGSPSATAVDGAGNIFFAGNAGTTLFVVYEGGAIPALLGAVTTQASTPIAPVKGAIYQVSAVTSNCNYCYQDGLPATQAFLNNIQGMSFDPSGNLFIAAGLNMYAVFRVDAQTTQLRVVAGQFDLQSSYQVGDTIQGVPARSVTLSAPSDVKTDSFGNFYFTDDGNVVAFVVYSGSQPPPVLAAEGVFTTPSDEGNIYTIAGQLSNFCAGPGTCTDAGPANGSLISGAISLSVDASGNVYILDNYAYTVRVIYVGGTAPPLLSVVAQPQAGNIYTIAGGNTQFTPCSAAPCGDGDVASNILLSSPHYLAVDAGGDLYIDDSMEHAIRKVDSTGKVSTVAGIADPNATPPVLPAGGGPASSTQLNAPSTIAFNQQDTLYIADSGYDVVWAVGSAKSQSITFLPLDSPVRYGTSQIALDATASSGLTVQYAVTGPAIVSGSGSTAELNVTGAGVVTVTVQQPGDTEYSAAAPVSQTITVTKASLTVSAADASKKHGQPNPAFSAIYSGFVNNDTAATALTGQPTITTTATTASGPGIYPLTISQGSLASVNYAFTFVDGTLTVTGTASQVISFPALAPITYGQASSLALNATASSGLPVQYTVASGPGKVSGSTLTIEGGGTIVITASQPGDNTYAGATPVTQSLIVRPASLTVTAPALSYPFGTVIDTNSFPAPTISGFVGKDGPSLVAGSAQYTTNASGMPQGGTYSLNVSRGTLSVVPAAADNYVLATFVPSSLIITPATQTISNLPLPPVSYGGGPYSVTSTASSGLPVSFVASGPIAFSGSNVTDPSSGVNSVSFYTTGVGPATLTLTQAGNADFAAASPLSLHFNVNKAELDVQAVNQILEEGAPTPALTYRIGQNVQGFQDIPSVVSGVPVLTTSVTPDSPPGTYPIVVSLGTLAATNYYFRFINGTLTVTPPGKFTITANPSSLTIPSGLSASATLTISPVNAYQGTVTLSCGQVPAHVTCVVSPSTYSFPGSQNPDGSENSAQGTITVSTSAGTVVGSVSQHPSVLQLAGFLFPGGLAFGILAWRRGGSRLRDGMAGFLLLATLVVGFLTMTSCGGPNGLPSAKAAPGTSTVTINGSGTTPSGTGVVTTSAPITLTIQ